MAKKSVAALQTGSKRLSKAIKMVKSPKTGAYTFVEAIMAPEDVNDYLKKYNQLYLFHFACPFLECLLLKCLFRSDKLNFFDD